MYKKSKLTGIGNFDSFGTSYTKHALYVICTEEKYNFKRIGMNPRQHHSQKWDSFIRAFYYDSNPEKAKIHVSFNKAIHENQFLARLDEVQEEPLYYPQRRRWRRRRRRRWQKV